MIDEKNLIIIRDNVFQTLGATTLRQVLIWVSGLLLPAAMSHGYAETAALMILALGTAGYGLAKKLRDKRVAVAMGNALPDSVARVTT